MGTEIEDVNKSIDEIAAGAKGLVSTFFKAFMIYEDHLQTIAGCDGDSTQSGRLARKALDEVKALMQKPTELPCDIAKGSKIQTCGFMEDIYGVDESCPF